MELDEFDPPDKPDFRRIGKGIPYVVRPDGTGKRIRYSRSSNSGKILDDESNLTDWKLRTVVAGAAQRPELMAAASVLDVDLNKKQLREIAEQCLVAGKGERRSVIGTAVHAMFDHIDNDDDWLPPPNFKELCDAYCDFKREWGLEVVDIEIHCINDKWKLAGTLDRRYRTTRTLVAPDGTIIPIGSILVGDHKTGKELEYSAGSYCTQLAAYVDSMRYDVQTDERSVFDPPSVSEWALIVHADSAGTVVNPYWVDIESGRQGLELASRVKGWRRADGLLTLAREPVGPSTGAGAPTIPAVDDRPAERHTGASAIDREASREESLRARVVAIVQHSDIAAKALARGWPVGIPGLKHTGHSWEQLDSIETVVASIEAQYSVPFSAPWIDPAETSMHRHPSNGMKIPRAKSLLTKWVDQLALFDMTDSTTIISSLIPFAELPEDEWSNDDVELMLTGCLNALGINNLYELTAEHSVYLLSAAFAIASGTAMLLFDETDNPIVRVPTVKE